MEVSIFIIGLIGIMITVQSYCTLLPNGIHWTTCLIHGWLVTIRPTSSPTSVY